MRVLKVAVWGMGFAIIVLVGLLFWKVAEIYGEKTAQTENSVVVEQQAVPVTASDAAQPIAVQPGAATASTFVTTAGGGQVVLDLPGELKDISANDGVLLLKVRLEKKRWMAISIDQSNGKILSRIVLNSQ